MLTEGQWNTVAPYLVHPDRGEAKYACDLLSDGDRDLAKKILSSKQHVGPLGMIEVGIVLGRMIADMDNPAVDPTIYCPKPDSIWRHRKGGTYLVKCVARVEATLEHVVVYHKVHQPSDVWTRPVSQFMDGRFVEIEQQ